MTLPLSLDDDAVSASVDGIRQCLRLLAEEAAVLKLRGTYTAIEAALAMIASEADDNGGLLTAPPQYLGLTLH